MMAGKLRSLIPRQQFEVPIQTPSALNHRAREKTSARSARTSWPKCYGGDISRKRKLLEKQKAGKKRMKNIGSVEVPPEAFIAALSSDEPAARSKLVCRGARLPETLPAEPVAAAHVGQCAPLGPAVRLPHPVPSASSLVALYPATPGRSAGRLMLYNISGFISTLVVPSRADRQGDYLPPALVRRLTIALAAALASSPEPPMAVLALVAHRRSRGRRDQPALRAHQSTSAPRCPGIMRRPAPIFSFAWWPGSPIATFMIPACSAKRSVLWAVVAIAALGLAFTILRMMRGGPRRWADRLEDSRGPVLTVLREPRAVAVATLAFLVLVVGTHLGVRGVVALSSPPTASTSTSSRAVSLGTCRPEILILLGLGRLTTRFRAARLLLVGSIAGLIYTFDGRHRRTRPARDLQVLNAIFIATVQGSG